MRSGADSTEGFREDDKQDEDKAVVSKTQPSDRANSANAIRVIEGYTPPLAFADVREPYFLPTAQVTNSSF
jgi:hypothetical protein